MLTDHVRSAVTVPRDCSQNQWTALHWAADRGHTLVVAALLTAKANTQITGRVCTLLFMLSGSENNVVTLRGFPAGHFEV